ncbi:hypothetical protein MATL_G00176040 [Megalops atlanticus]|uniref:Uncharacterized protein n=1 Tax=Megalops atlanticus TaxID=7932 RepID=A0A9D3PM49_MEGAT|nr:hypothetical protein MATL_G00176040 [Megalops atlanticus]
MFICFKCQSGYVTSQLLITHLCFEPGFYPDSNFKLICAQQTYRKQFAGYVGFCKHLDTNHQIDTNCESKLSVRCNIVSPGSSSRLDYPEPNSIVEESFLDSGNFVNSGSSGRKHERRVQLLMSNYKGVVLPVTQSHQLSDLEEIATEMHSHIKQTVLSAVPTSVSLRSAIELKFDSFQNPFSCLNSDYKRAKYFSEKWGIIEPVEIVLGIRYDTRRNRKTGTYCQVPVNDMFVYIPILETLKFIFRNPEICEKIKAGTSSNENIYRDFSDGSYFKTHPLFSKHMNALLIQLYYDDFETANPLGSKRSIHKVGCLYFVLRNLPPQFNSAVLNIQLVSLFHSQDLKYGFDLILEPLISDLKKLESEGLHLPISSEKVFGTISQVTGDNLGLHSILGFSES